MRPESEPVRGRALEDRIVLDASVEAVWRAIQLAQESGDWRPSPSRLCDWCSFHPYCPTKGGTVPPLPDRTPPAADASADESED